MTGRFPTSALTEHREGALGLGRRELTVDPGQMVRAQGDVECRGVGFDMLDRLAFGMAITPRLASTQASATWGGVAAVLAAISASAGRAQQPALLDRAE